MPDWRSQLKADPTTWLLEPENPPVRYRTLVEILDRPPDDAEVLTAKAAIPTYPPLAELLSKQKRDGRWGQPDYYLPRRSLGTFWVLTALGDMGLTVAEEAIQRACDFMFTHQRETGQFNRRRRVSGQGMVWRTSMEPCTHARIVRFLIQFGLGDDPRVRRAIDWIMTAQRDDGMWFCREEGIRGCLRVTIDVLRIAALDPETASQPGIPPAAAAVSELLMQPRMSRYHIGEAWGTWERLQYPYFGFSVINALDALTRLGFSLSDPGIDSATGYLLSRQRPDGTWPLDENWANPPIDFGSPGEPNKWLTLDAARVIKQLFS
jgi:hypothetical protein